MTDSSDLLPYPTLSNSTPPHPTLTSYKVAEIGIADRVFFLKQRTHKQAEQNRAKY